MMEQRAQVSLEYLLMVGFTILLVIIATALVIAIQAVASKAQAQVLDVRSKTISSLLS